jgi:hypothetical protein
LTTTVPRTGDEELLCCSGPAFRELEVTDPARICRIAAELAYGFTRLRHLTKAVSILGSARLPQTGKVQRASVILVGTRHWNALVGRLREHLVVTDDPAEVAELVQQARREQPRSLAAPAHSTGTLT